MNLNGVPTVLGVEFCLCWQLYTNNWHKQWLWSGPKGFSSNTGLKCWLLQIWHAITTNKPACLLIVFLPSILCFVDLLGNIFSQKKTSTFYRLFPWFIRIKTFKEKQTTFFTQNWLFTLWKCKITLHCQLVFEPSPPRPDSHSHISPSGG